MDKKLTFLIAIHFHQPVGNFDSVIERVCKRCYEPFIETIKDFGDIKFNLHFSGSLLEWIRDNRPKLFERIRRLAQQKRIEIIGGGFYEPIFPSLSPQDAREQITSFSKFLKKEFAQDVKGAWLTERVWEPHLAEVFNDAGIDYTIVDDTHLRYSGLTENQLYGYYITEDNGKCVRVFPSDKHLRYMIPFQKPEESLKYFKKIRDVYKKGVVLYGDDGEKFGEWPGTYDWVYKKKWLYKFLKMLSDNSSWLKTEKISEYMDSHESEGRLYIPNASYHEMSEWSLPSKSSERFIDIIEDLKNKGKYEKYVDFVRGGFWRNFLVKYPEANHIQKRALLTSHRLRDLEQTNGKNPSISRKLKNAKIQLFKSECNCAYWHGVFGGLYLYHLRRALYRHLISAEKILDSIQHQDQNWIDIQEKDFDCDGHCESIVNTRFNSFIIDRSNGGIITDWAIKKRDLNILNTLSRRHEAYHRKLIKRVSKKSKKSIIATIHDIHFSAKDMLAQMLVYDENRRALCLDHFIDDDVKLKDIIANRYTDLGDFATGEYRLITTGTNKDPFVELQRHGLIDGDSLKITKRFRFFPTANKLGIEYDIRNASSKKLNLNFAPELNFSLTHDTISKEIRSVNSIKLVDRLERVTLRIVFSQKANKLYRYPIHTISQSEKDIERNYQATCIMPTFFLAISPGSLKRIGISIAVS
ncbi:alpha-amylase/4-alpha-glucanotransferase domain-containing protein [Candidatus Omnitrophota bacterium]